MTEGGGGPDRATLLAARPVACARTREAMAAALTAGYGVRRVDFAASHRPFFAMANRAEIGAVTLHYCRYDTPVEVQSREAPGARLFFPLSGAGELGHGAMRCALDSRTMALAPHGIDYLAAYGEGFTQLVVQIDEQALARKSALLFGVESGEVACGGLESAPASRMHGLRKVALALAGQFAAPDAYDSLLAAELEQALLIAYLTAPVAKEAAAAEDRGRVSSALMTRLEDYMHASWNQPLTVEAVAEACGASVRNVFALFKAERGVTPHAYLRNLRLDRARELLQSQPDASVLDVAIQCGFASFGHFARRFQERFGELPSAARTRGAD